MGRCEGGGPAPPSGHARFLGIDIGAESVKIIELIGHAAGMVVARKLLFEHGKRPQSAILAQLAELQWPAVTSAAVTGRLRRLLRLPQIPIQAAQTAALEFRFPGMRPIMLISIGSRGFSVLSLGENGKIVFRENSRCSQGTGNFLIQLSTRLGLSIEQACDAAARADHSAPLSGRCPVILKTDMTHLGNKGESRDRILAGLFDAVCENVQSLINSRLAPKHVVLAGGLSRASRVRQHFQRYLDHHGMELMDLEAEDGMFLEATGAALESALLQTSVPPLDKLVAAPAAIEFEEVPALRSALPKIHRMSRRSDLLQTGRGPMILGFDIGSTGSKLVALDLKTREPFWEAYVNTGGNPIHAAQELARRFLQGGREQLAILAFGVTGSGREIVGSLLASCYGTEAVMILNEIAAHAAGALHYDPGVDTIFEIGGQDAKYVRLAAGQVCDTAMNETCSAGTGSFIEEQGCRFAGVDNLASMERLALKADTCVSLGQQCSVFMAEVIDAAVAAGRDVPEIVAGVYDSVIQNYLNRVKGNRSTGDKIFCQGMPFSSDALAAAVANRTMSEVTVPPSPGTIGALGIALLAARELPSLSRRSLSLDPFLSATLIERDDFQCRSRSGCGGAGNKCRIERLTASVENKMHTHQWGGGCALYDQGIGKKKLPNLAPDPFRERRELIQSIVDLYSEMRPGHSVVAVTDEFVLKGLFPFFATYLWEMGFNLLIRTDARLEILKLGVEEVNVSYCAPLQLYSGLASRLASMKPDYLLLPMVRDIPKMAGEPLSITCTLAQASADILRLNLRGRTSVRMLTPVIDMGPEGLDSENFRRCCSRLASSLGARPASWQSAFERACAAQCEFQSKLLKIGSRALDFAGLAGATAVVVLGRPYTIHNVILNSNVPVLLRELGAIAVPVDCYPVATDVPVFKTVYWGYSQMNLRAAYQIRRTPGVYSVFCSNYSCGPDSFTLQFYTHLMEGKPCAVIETDGHAGDAGTKTRLEAFLYCIKTNEREKRYPAQDHPTALHILDRENAPLAEIVRGDRLLLIPRMGAGAEVLASTLRAECMRAEALPEPDGEAISLGRRYTSGKECLPFTATLGSCLRRLFSEEASERYALLMPTSYGPCRFGIYNLFDKLLFSRLGLRNRISVISPAAGSYFKGLPHGLALKLWAAVIAEDLLLDMLHHVRLSEKQPGLANAIYQQYFNLLNQHLEGSPAPSLAGGVLEICDDVFGLRSFLARAAGDFAGAADNRMHPPTVACTGEIYVRCSPGCNDSLIDRLEERGLRVRLASAHEWIEYTDWSKWRGVRERRRQLETSWLAATLSTLLKRAALGSLYSAVCEPMNWKGRVPVSRLLGSAAPYLSSCHRGEAVLTIGGPLFMHRRGEISGAVCVAPLECLPSKVAESQLYHASGDTDLITLALYLNGDPLDVDLLDNFAYEVNRKHLESTLAIRPWLRSVCP